HVPQHAGGNRHHRAGYTRLVQYRDFERCPPRRPECECGRCLLRNLDVLLLVGRVCSDAVGRPVDLLARAARVLPRASLGRESRPGVRTVNVLFVDQFSDLGGAQQCLLDLAPAIQAEGWKMTCAVPGAGSLVTKLGELGITVSTLAMTAPTSGRKHPLDFLRFSLDTPKLARDIGHLAAEFRADLIYVNGPRVLPTAAWVARRTGRPMVFHCHNYLGQRPAAILAGR